MLSTVVTVLAYFDDSVSASDKTTKSNRITITNNKGRLSKEIEHMANEAKKYEAEDEAAAARLQAKSALETYVYNLCNSINEEKFAGKFDPVDKSELESAISLHAWLEGFPGEVKWRVGWL